MEIRKTTKEFHEVSGIDTTKEDWEKEGFKVINFSMVKSEYMKVIDNADLAHRFHLFNPYQKEKDEELQQIYDYFQTIVFKESRGGRGRIAIGWENINSYLLWHSGIIYKWFQSQPVFR